MIQKQSLSKMMWSVLAVYVFLFVSLYLFYSFYIDAMHSSLNPLSITSIVLPYVLLVAIVLFISKSKHVLPNGRTRKVLFAVILMGLVVSALLFFKLGMNEEASHFSQDRWINNPESRVYIVDDLLANYNIKGLTNQEITQLLGAPTEDAYFVQDNNEVYLLGKERGFFRIDSEWLVLSFDAQHKVTEHQILKD